MKNTGKQQAKKSVSFALRQLLLEGSACTQEDICKTLQKQGFPVNQPKVSRLLHKIGAVKVTNQNGQNIYRLPHEFGLAHEFARSATKLSIRQWVIDIVSNGFLIVIHTTPGAGQLIAREVDLHHLNLGILGSIAGDDTVFVAPKDIKRINAIVDEIKTILEL